MIAEPVIAGRTAGPVADVTPPDPRPAGDAGAEPGEDGALLAPEHDRRRIAA